MSEHEQAMNIPEEDDEFVAQEQALPADKPVQIAFRATLFDARAFTAVNSVARKAI